MVYIEDENGKNITPCFPLVFHGWQASPTGKELWVKNTHLEQEFV